MLTQLDMLTQDDVIYFLLTDRFANGDTANDQGVKADNDRAFHGGDFAGLVSKIPYFQALGITAVWLSPVYVNVPDVGDQAGYHGYWPMDFERIDPHLYSHRPDISDGSPAHLRAVVDAFHAAGIKVILDMVVNHTGYHTPAYAAYPEKKFEKGHFNVHREGDPTHMWLSGLPDLDHDKPEVADYFVQNILDWVEQTGIDGIRMDTVKHVEDTFWYLFKSQIKTRFPRVTLIGEVLEYDPWAIGHYQQVHGFDTLFDFPLCGRIKDTLVWDGPLTRLAKPRLSKNEPDGTLDLDEPYANANRLVTLLDNHDLERRITTEIMDRVGAWDRDLTAKILKLCLSLLFTTRGVPQIYYGTEIGLQGRKDPDNRRDMPWSIFGPDHRPTAAHPFEREVFDHVRKMVRLRADNPAIRYGYLFTLYVDRFFYAYLREFQGNVIVVLNNGRDPMPAPLSVNIALNGNIPVRIKQLLADGRVLTSQFAGMADLTMHGGKLDIQVPGKTAGVYLLPAPA